MSIASLKVSERHRVSRSTETDAASGNRIWDAALASAAVDANSGPQARVDPRISKVQWQPINGGPLAGGGFLVLGRNPQDPPLSPSVVSKVHKGVIKAQLLVDNAERRISGHWDSSMKRAGMLIFGFGPNGPSSKEKARLAKKFALLAQELRGKVVVNIARTHMMGGAAGLVPVKGAHRGQVHMALEWIRDPKNVEQVIWCFLHEYMHHALGAKDTGYIDPSNFYFGRGVLYPQGVTNPMNNADSITAFAHAI
jgi:hypothetical protein